MLIGDDQDEWLLGGHGDDWVYAGSGASVLWGDAIPTATDFPHQFDHLIAGPGLTFICTNHGADLVQAGSGTETIHAEYGHGVIRCGAGDDTVLMTKASRRAFSLPVHCTKIEIVLGRGG